MSGGPTAQVSVKRLAYIVLARIGIAREEVDGQHDHAGRAESALEPVFRAERLLDEMELSIGCQAFDGRDFRSIGLYGQEGAGFARLAIQEDHAGAALAGVAAGMGSGEMEVITEEIDK